MRTVLPSASILVVDDGSPDGTADLADAVATEVGEVEVLRRPGKAGLGSAYRAGFAHGIERGFDVLIEMDADLSHDPADLPRLVAAVDDGASLADRVALRARRCHAELAEATAAGCRVGATATSA